MGIGICPFVPDAERQAPVQRQREINRLAAAVLFCLGASGAVSGGESPRLLAPGVLTVIPPDRQEADTFSGPREMVELVHGVAGLSWKPNYAPESDTLAELASRVIFRRPVWCLEFSFMPLRMTTVALPQPDGQMADTRVWYLVYRVRNTGFHIRPAAKPDPFGNELYELELVNHTIRFFPRLVLECFDQQKAYIDRVIPLAVEKIQSAEDPGIKLHNSVDISLIDIPVSTEEEDHSVWGVATWVGVDPRTDFFGIFVQRLTNAYRWEDPEGALKEGDPPGTGRIYQFKTLQLNFWRPGDSVREHQGEIRFGLPSIEDVQGSTVATEADLLKLYQISEPRDHVWVDRP
jgi:hypothetical protein